MKIALGNMKKNMALGSQVALGSFSFTDRDLKTKPKDNIVRLLSLAINDHCNLACGHCIQEHYSSSEDTESVLEDRLIELKRSNLGIKYTSFSAKEPTETPERLIKLASIAKQFSETILMTNAYGLSPELQHNLEGIIDYLDPSIDAAEGAAKSVFSDGKPNIAWQNIRYAINNHYFKKVGIIITTMSDTYLKLRDLFDVFSEEFGENPKVSATLWFYLGLPGDNLLLNEAQFNEAVSTATEHRYKNIQIIVPSTYNNFLPKLFEEHSTDSATKRYCSKTGTPSYLINGKKLIIADEIPCSLLRIEHDGRAFSGCGHLIYSSKDSLDKFSLGNIRVMTIKEIYDEMEKNYFYGKESFINYQN